MIGFAKKQIVRRGVELVANIHLAIFREILQNLDFARVFILVAPEVGIYRILWEFCPFSFVRPLKFRSLSNMQILLIVLTSVSRYVEIQNMDGVSLSKIADVRSGFPFRSKVEIVPRGGVFVAQPKDIVEGGVLNHKGIVRTQVLNLKPDYVLNPGDTLLATRGRIAAADYFGQSLGFCVASGSLFVLRPKQTEDLAPGYLTVFFNSDYGRSCLTRIVAQTTSTFVSLSDLMSLQIPLPDMELQMRLIALARSTARYASLTRRRTALMNSLVSLATHF